MYAGNERISNENLQDIDAAAGGAAALRLPQPRQPEEGAGGGPRQGARRSRSHARREGTRKLYSVRPEGFQMVEAFLREFWTGQLGALKSEIEKDG